MQHRVSRLILSVSFVAVSLHCCPTLAADHVVDERTGTAIAAQTAGVRMAESEWRRTLIECAFDAASRVPNEVHGRERARLQESAGLAALASGDAIGAKNFARRIDGWRRGALLAEIALAEAKLATANVGGATGGDAAKARELVRQALEVVPSSLDWQRERIQVMCGRALAWLGDDAEASRLEKGVGESEMGKVAAARAARFPDAAFDAQMTQLDGWLATRNFDLVRNAAEVCLEYYPHCIADPARRARIETALAAAIDQLAYDQRIDVLIRMAGIAGERGEAAAAADFVAKAEAVRSAATWALEDAVVQRARIAAARARIPATEAAGKSASNELAATDIAAAVALFDAEREHIADIFRAAPLRAIAEAQVALGDRAAARVTLERALREGLANPNARPRAADLVQTALCLARLGIEPDAGMMASLRSASDGLVAPW